MIIAEETLDRAALDDVIVDRVRRGATVFHVVVVLVPTMAPESGLPAWGSIDVGAVIAPNGERSQDVQSRLDQRLAGLVWRISAMGGNATGEVIMRDVVGTVREILARERFDELVISAMGGVASWLKVDLASRISRITNIPVTVVRSRKP